MSEPADMVSALARPVSAHEPAASASAVRTVALVNPLRAALGHDERSTAEVLASLGVSVRAFGISEPSASGEHQLRWLARYAQTLRRAASERPDRLLSLWPVIGYLDFAVLRAFGGAHGSLIVHDPSPLVDAKGYGRVARAAASSPLVRAAGVVHTPEAARVVAEEADLSSLVTLLHPTIAPSAVERRAGDRVVVRVMGQYKTDRDLDAMRRFAAGCPSEWALEIIGRGWPEVEGWACDGRFVPEDEFRRLTETASVVLIPYRRFFQSGVAIRCLESGVPVVGPGGTSLDELFGSPDHPWLTTPDGWIAAARHAVEHPEEAETRHRDYHRRVLRSWGQWLQAEGDHG